MICPACNTKNDSTEEYCLNCGQRLIESEDKEEIPETKLKIPKDKIILLDLNYTHLQFMGNQMGKIARKD